MSGGPTSFTLDPDVDFADGESCTVTVFAANVTDQDDTPDNMAADFVFSFTAVDVCVLAYTPIYDIQGSGPAAAITGAVTTQGVVVGDYEGPSPTLRGFYMQDATGDGDPATSDGIFVFNGNNDNVNLGDVVRVTGIGRRVPGPDPDQQRDVNRQLRHRLGGAGRRDAARAFADLPWSSTKACWSASRRPST